MQRRAAAIYLAFFVVAGAAAYGLIVTAEAPEISMDGETLADGSEVTYGDRTYELSVSGASGELAWSNESAIETAELDNGTEVPVTDVRWDDQSARQEVTFEDGATAAYNGSEYAVTVADGTLTLTNPDNPADNASFEAGDTIEYRGFDATVTDVGDGAATVVRGFPYLLTVDAEGVADPTEATFREQPDLAQLAANDPAVYDEINDVNGTRVVTYRANDTNVPVETYSEDPETHTVAEGERLTYQGEEWDVHEVSNTSVELRRDVTATETVDLAEGENVTLAGEQYFAHFPDNSSVMLLSTDERYADYSAETQRQDHYQERINGLWGITQMSIVAVIILVATAFLPVRG